MGRVADIRAALSVALWAAPLVAFAGNLDAPVEEKPTVRSEIVRGYEAGEACPASPPLLQFEDCYNGARDRYRLSHSNTDAYELGLDFRRWSDAAIRYQVRSELASMNPLAAGEVKLARSLETLAYYDVLGKLKALDLTEDELFVALGAAGESRRDEWAAAKATHAK